MSENMQFGGDRKEGVWALKKWEDALRAYLVPKVPKWLETYHLTLATALWSTAIIGFSFLARYNINWLWLVSLMIVFQYISDLLDGAVGRARNTGLVKWGYYMDHFLDYCFLSSIIIGYSILLPDHYKFIFFYMQAVVGAFMVSTFLAFAATNEFKISYFGLGPTEIRILFIAINAMLIALGRSYLELALPYVLFLCSFILCIVVYNTQKKLWHIDMQ